MMGLRRGALGIALCAMVAGCHGPVRVPLLGVGPLRVGDPTLYDDVLGAARAAGHPPLHADAEHGRFEVRASSDPTRETTFVVQCSRDGFVTVTPEGRRVIRNGDTFEVTPEVRREWAELVIAIERTVPETP